MSIQKQSSLIDRFIRILSLAVFLFAVGFGRLPSAQAQVWSSTHQITHFQGNKPGAISITFDDGLATQAGNGASALNARGLKGTFFILPYRGEVSWATWNNLAAQGHEIASHTVSHSVLTTLSEAQITWELSESQSIINQNIPGQACLTISYPQTASNSLIQSISDNYYVASRGGWSAGSPNFYEPDGDPYGSWNAIDFANVGSTQGDNLSLTNWSFNRALDTIVQYHGWYDLHFHEIDNPTSFGNLLDYILARGDVYWIDTFSNVSRYMKERLNSTIQVLTDNSSEIRIRLVMNASLSTAIYNVPLTVRSTVPASWVHVTIRQGGTTQTAIPVFEGGENVIYYNAIPNGGDIVLTPPNPLPVLTSLDPSLAYVGDPSFTLVVNGANFVSSSVVRWNNADRPTTYINQNQLNASISAADIASLGLANVRVYSPAPGGGLSNQVSLVIGPKPVTITVDAGQSKRFGEADPVLTYSASDPAASFTGALSREPGEDVGTYAISQGSLAVVGSNYFITSFVPGEFTIERLPATVQLGDLSHEYDGSAKTVTVTTNPPGLPVDVTYAGGALAPRAAGSYSVAATVNHPNYAGVGTAVMVIDPALVVPSVTADDKTYDGGRAATLLTRDLSGVLGGDEVSLTGGLAEFADKNVGIGKVVTVTGLVLSGAEAGNYQLSSTTASASADIEPRRLTVTASGINKVFDGTTTADVTLTDDRLGGDDLTVTYVSAFFLGPDVASNKLVTVNGIALVGGADLDNYLLANSTATTTANITPAGQGLTVTTPAPASASEGSSFVVAATASSGLPVTITASGACSGSGAETVAISMTSGFGVCSVLFAQAGNLNFAAAEPIQQDVIATQKPGITSSNQASFDIGFLGAFSITTSGNPATPMEITVSGALPPGVTFVDHGDGTATLVGLPTASGTYPLTITADNGIPPRAEQAFTLKVRNGAMIEAVGVRTTSNTSEAPLYEYQMLSDTLGLRQLTVKFSQDVYDPELDSEPKDVTNPANYLLLLGGVNGEFATRSCAEGVAEPDVAIAIDQVTYDNGGGNGPFVATLSINGGLPLNIPGYYRLYVCGSTSIVDAANLELELAGDGLASGTDFMRTFRIEAQVNRRRANTTGTLNSSLSIPVTGFAPGKVTPLPAQPASAVYQALGELQLEIPTIGVQAPIVGAVYDSGWNLTWLGNQVAYLEGSAYPTLSGNTVLAGHLTDANNQPGPFSNLKDLQTGQHIYLHANGQVYVYQIQENRKILPFAVSAVFAHEDYDWLTLVTCEDFNANSGIYVYRRIVRAILISIIPE